MAEMLFVPITCESCLRKSIQSLPVADMRHSLAVDAAIELRCWYDDARWVATANERRKITTLLQENDWLGQRTWLRLRSEPSNLEAA